ncbi:MAG: dihydropteroate synthase [Thiogranum sp.]|jgi:dihydropteroate synthase|nr:dihydropteroate synthase [Thiogranum sp.]
MRDTPVLTYSRPLLMGILNVTPDSFSDGGAYRSLNVACEHALDMAAQGADIIDVGGESTRPGSRPVSDREQIDRVIPVIRELHDRLPPGVIISTDTRSAVVAEAALAAGATMLNDVSAGLGDPRMLGLAAESGAYLALMHMQGEPETMQDNADYGDVVAEVRTFLLRCAAQAMDNGVREDQLVIDPGIGFGKRREHNLQLLSALQQFVATGLPVMLGTSRKRFMGSLCQVDEPRDLGPATVATTAIGVMAGARIFRVHDVRENRQAADIAAAVRQVADTHTGQ